MRRKPAARMAIRSLLTSLALTALLPYAAQAQLPTEAEMLDRYYELRETSPDAAFAYLLQNRDPGGADVRVPLELGYYHLARESYREALPFFEAAAVIAPERKEIWDQIGYIRSALGEDAEAVAAFDRSLELNPSDETIRLQRAYSLQRLGRNREAASAFYALSCSADERIAGQACQSYGNLYDQIDSLFKPPWFGETYFAPHYNSHFDLSVFPFQGRIGKVLDHDSELEAYVSLRASADTRSGQGIFGPQYFNDNAAILAAGLRVRPWDKFPISFFVEAGGAYDITSRNRDRWRGDLRGGFIIYEDWNMESRCICVKPGIRPVAELYAEGIYYSRYDDNILFFARARPGLRLMESDSSAVDVYLHAAAGTDTEDSAGNQYEELGGGIAARFFRLGGLTVRAEAVRVYRHDGLDSYSTFRIGLEHAVRF